MPNVQVDIKVQGKTALQVASHQGFVRVVEELIKAGANLEIKDDDGDNALHYAAFGYVPPVHRASISRHVTLLKHDRDCKCFKS